MSCIGQYEQVRARACACCWCGREAKAAAAAQHAEPSTLNLCWSCAATCCGDAGPKQAPSRCCREEDHSHHPPSPATALEWWAVAPAVHHQPAADVRRPTHDVLGGHACSWCLCSSSAAGSCGCANGAVSAYGSTSDQVLIPLLLTWLTRGNCGLVLLPYEHTQQQHNCVVEHVHCLPGAHVRQTWPRAPATACHSPTTIKGIQLLLLLLNMSCLTWHMSKQSVYWHGWGPTALTPLPEHSRVPSGPCTGWQLGTAAATPCPLQSVTVKLKRQSLKCQATIPPYLALSRAPRAC